MTTVETATLIRHGTTLRLGLSGGLERVLRRIDLAGILGESPIERAAWPIRRRLVRVFSRAEVIGGDVHITYDDGGSEAIPGSYLAARALRHDRSVDRIAELVIDGAGRVLTADGNSSDPLGMIDHGAVVCGGGRILWLGPSNELSRSGCDLSRARRIDAGGRLVSPGLIDCHAHPLFAGNRADEFASRAKGQSYLDIAAAGGGIRATIEPTRRARFDQHIALTADRMAGALAAGTTTCEAKSGYDLTADGELRLLDIAWAVDALQPVDLVPTLLGAHVVPPEYAADRAQFVALVIENMIPEAARRGLSHTVDVYCDEGAFSRDESRDILRAARHAGMHVRAHVGQFSDLGGAEMVADLGGLSADHLEHVSPAGMAALAAHSVVGVMLPGACVQLRSAPPPVALLRDAGVALAVASALNPGTSHCETLPVQMWLATTHYGMTVTEAWLGTTVIAARAIGRHDIGVLAPHARADLVVWDAESPAEIPYHYGANLVHKVVKDGRVVVSG